MSALKNFVSYSKRISEEREVWQIAFRKKNKTPLYKGNSDGFILVPNNTRYWRADPFVFKYKNKNYLFAEMLDRKKHKGVIGVAKLKGNKCSGFKVCLSLPYHLSYPCVFENADGIFMIPECCESGEIAIYKSVKFPLNWEKYKTLQKCAAVDTTPIFDDTNHPVSYLTSMFEPKNGGNDNLCGFKDDQSIEPIFSQNASCRCAGHLIKDRGLLRPIQDDDGTYGNSMYFSTVLNSDIKSFEEQKFLQVLPPGSLCNDNQVAVSVTNNKKDLNYIGVHTYNSNEDYEVVDLLVEKQNNLLVFWRNRKKLIMKYVRKMK